MNKPFSFEEFKAMYTKVPRLTVEIIIKNEQGILLTRRAIPSYKGKWIIPGGTVYFKERLENAARRVAQEELGIEVTVKKQLGVIEYLETDSEDGFDHPVGVAMLCTTNATDFKLDSSADDVKYFSQLPEEMIKEQKDFLNSLTKDE